MSKKTGLTKYLPILEWGRAYNRDIFTKDILAAVIVTIMLIPQSLAYALLAGLPAEVGLYASIVPLVLYALFGTSRALAVGPVAVVSLMTLTSVSVIAEPGTIGYLETAMALALLSGLMMVVMGIFRMGFIANFLSHPIISGFITASGLLIAFSQLKHLIGISVSGRSLPEQVISLSNNISTIHWPTVAIGVSSLLFLLWVRTSLKGVLTRLKLGPHLSDALVKAGPVFAVIATIGVTASMGLDQMGVKIVGDIPSGLPNLSIPNLDMPIIQKLLVAALLISLVGYVESVSVGQTLAAKKRQKIDPDQELIALGFSNIGSAVSGGYPVTGGFARSVVNFDAGAETPAAGAYTAVGIAVATLFLTPYLYFLPTATLAATIIVAVLSLVKFKPIIEIFHYSKGDFIAMAATIALTLIQGVEMGIAAGMILSIVIFLYRTTVPHYAIVGQVGTSEHFRNIKRHVVKTQSEVLNIRIDGSLYFANMRYLENEILCKIADNPACQHVVLQCSAINFIDFSAVESLEMINERLKSSGISLHLSEVKGPVEDRLKRSHFLDHLSGKIYLSQYDAAKDLEQRISTHPG